jgi:hypothetical protein
MNYVQEDDDDNNGALFGPFYVDRKGNYAFKYLVNVDEEEVVLQIKGLKGCLELTEWEEEVEGLWIKGSSRLDSDMDSADSDE